jgi:tellurite resistance protein TehA-like permease
MPPPHLAGLYHIGLTMFLANILLFLVLCTCTVLRLILHPAHFASSFLHPQESLFLGSFWLSLSVILAGIQTYGITHGPFFFFFFFFFSALPLACRRCARLVLGIRCFVSGE